VDVVGPKQVRDDIADLDTRGHAGVFIAQRVTDIRGRQRLLIAEELSSRVPNFTIPAMRRPKSSCSSSQLPRRNLSWKAHTRSLPITRWAS